jgi:hypothetical protein
LIWNRDDVMVGHIEFFRPVNYWDAYELSYQLYGAEHTGQGYTTEAVRLLVDYLFGAKKVNCISLVIVPENAPSRRIAEKCAFQLEGTASGAFFNGGRNVDVLSTRCSATTLDPGTNSSEPAWSAHPRRNVRGDRKRNAFTDEFGSNPKMDPTRQGPGVRRRVRG